MAADLYLNAVPDTVESHYLLLKLQELNVPDEYGFVESTDEYSETMTALYELVEDRVHIGEVSFLKAAFSGDGYWLPGPVMAVLSILGNEWVPHMASRALSATITAAMSTPDRSHYRHWHRQARKWHRSPARRRQVKQFFARNEGAVVFGVVE